MKQETKGNGQKHKGDGNTTKKLNLKKKKKEAMRSSNRHKIKMGSIYFPFFL